jgi:hypothetical protein
MNDKWTSGGKAHRDARFYKNQLDALNALAEALNLEPRFLADCLAGLMVPSQGLRDKGDTTLVLPVSKTALEISYGPPKPKILPPGGLVQ